MTEVQEEEEEVQEEEEEVQEGEEVPAGSEAPRGKVACLVKTFESHIYFEGVCGGAPSPSGPPFGRRPPRPRLWPWPLGLQRPHGSAPWAWPCC